MNPWHCLVCCHEYKGLDLPHRVFAYWRNYIRKTEELIFEELDDNISQQLENELNNYRPIYDGIYLLEQPPDYVNLLLDNQLVDPPDPNLRTLTIYKEPDEINNILNII